MGTPGRIRSRAEWQSASFRICGLEHSTGEPIDDLVIGWTLGEWGVDERSPTARIPRVDFSGYARRGWVVTHLCTGLAIPYLFGTRRKAMDFAEFVGETRYRGKPGRIPGQGTRFVRELRGKFEEFLTR